MPDDDFANLLENLSEADFLPPPAAPAAPVETPTAAAGDQPEPAPSDFVQPAPPAPPAMAIDSEDMSQIDFSPQAAPPPVQTVSAPMTAEEIAEQQAFMGTIQIERDVPIIERPWMKNHTFKRVESMEEVRSIVDAAIKAGRCALDTETEGLDTRIINDAKTGKLRTIHQIVGYCLSYDGLAGYYIPVRHLPDGGGIDYNLPVEEVDKEISRLCWASQPKPAPGATDPLSFKEFAEPPKVVLYFWNAKFDQEMLFPVTGIDWWHPESYEDGLLACFCHYSADKTLSLKHKAPNQLRDEENNAYVMIELKELFIRGRPIKFQTLSPDEPSVIKYGCSDAICTFLLCEPPRKWEKDRIPYIRFAKDPKRYATTYRLEKQTTQVIRVMERYRVRVDKARAEELLVEYGKEFQRLLNEIQEFANGKGFRLDPSSPKQLSDFLFSDAQGCLNLSPKPEINEASKQYKTDGETLETMLKENPHAPPILKWVVDYRGVEKMIGTYLEHLAHNPGLGLPNPDSWELRFNFKQTGAATGRFSAPAEDASQGFSAVPIHGIPSDSSMRKLFVARDGYTLVKADYAGQELRIAANVSTESVWVREFLEGDGDLHTITARAFFNKEVISKDERKMGKIANFALIYGGGPQAIMRATGCDRMEGARRKQAFDKAVPTFAGWIKGQHNKVNQENGVWTSFRRWISIPAPRAELPPEEKKKQNAARERASTNYPIQGSGADIMKISLVMLQKEFHKRGWLRSNPASGYIGDDSVRMLLSVHDEVVFEIRHDRVVEATPIIVHIMETPGKMAEPRWVVPLIVEPLVGPNWGTGYKCDRAIERKAKAKREKKEYVLDEGEVEINGFVYGTIREVDIKKDGGGELPGVGEAEHSRTDKKRKIRITDAVWITQAPKTFETLAAAPVAHAAPVQTSEGIKLEVPTMAPAPVSAPAPKVQGRIAVIKINRLTEQTVEDVYLACCAAIDRTETGRVLRLTTWDGYTLIEPSLDIRINPKKLAEALDKKLNISDGRVTEEN